MSLLQEIFEATNDNIGVVISNRKGKFYDIHFVNYDTLKPVEGHAANLGKSLVRTLRDEDLFEEIEPLVKSKFKGKKLGEEYSTEDANFILYGPMSIIQLGQLIDKLREK